MKKMVSLKLGKIYDVLMLLLCIIFAEQLLWNSTLVGDSIRNSLQLCTGTLIPSLFCFMVLTSFLSRTGLGKLLALPLLPLSRLLCLPPEQGCILLMSLLGGYPVGIKALRDCWDRKEIDQKRLKRMVLFCCCPAPSFVILAVGERLLGSRSCGFLLYGAQLLSTFVIAALSSLFSPSASRKELGCWLRRPVRRSYSSSIVEAVQFSTQALLTMCGYVLLFGVLTALFQQLPLSEACAAFLSAFLEITNGSVQLVQIDLPQKLSAISFFLSFGGLAVLFQLKQILGDCPCSFIRLLIGRFLHGLCSALCCTFLIHCFPQAAAVFSPLGKPLPLADGTTPILTLCLIGMCIMFLSAVEDVALKQNK